MKAMAKLWQKNASLEALVERFTVGEDYLVDRNLVASDCVASMAHAIMLYKIGILNDQELVDLKHGLVEILRLNEKQKFRVFQSDEDCHTAIENFLSSRLGETGKKIHTGRSRNDQVIAALRLFARDFLLQFQEACLMLCGVLLDFAGKHAQVPMPGRTHMQIAMPSSVGLWAGAFCEEMLDNLLLVDSAYTLNNASPLGAAASYGVPLPLEREMVAELLAFQRVQNNVLYVNNSRGKVEAVILDAVEQVMLTLSKLAQDLIVFSLPEFGYFSLPEEVCTGSSIMPQKKNPDVLELMRAKAATVSALNQQVKAVIRSLPSGYNRDLQETKAPFVKGIRLGLVSVRVMELVVSKLAVHEEALLKGFKPEIYATDYALELVRQGLPFRDAYRRVAADLSGLRQRDPYQALTEKTSSGNTGNLGLEKSVELMNSRRSSLAAERQRVAEQLAALTGFDLELFSPEPPPD
jgi:argininosuccinate lyase